MRFYKNNYKNKWYYIGDYPIEPVGSLTLEQASDPDYVKKHKEQCDYYGIPPYIGDNPELNKIYKD